MILLKQDYVERSVCLVFKFGIDIWKEGKAASIQKRRIKKEKTKSHIMQCLLSLQEVMIRQKDKSLLLTLRLVFTHHGLCDKHS